MPVAAGDFDRSTMESALGFYRDANRELAPFTTPLDWSQELPDDDFVDHFHLNEAGEAEMARRLLPVILDGFR